MISPIAPWQSRFFLSNIWFQHMITEILNPCFYQRRTPFLGPPHSSGSLRAGRDGGKRSTCWITFKIGPRNSIALILLCVINLRLVLCKHLSVGWFLDFHLWVSCCQWESPLKRGWSYPPALQPLKFNTFKWIFPVPSPKAGEIALANFDDPGDPRIFGQATGAGPARARCSAESPSFDPSAGVAGVAGVAGPQISTRTLYNWKSPFEFWQSSIYKWDIIHSYVKLPGVGNVELWWGYAGIYNGIYSQQKWGYPDKAKLDPYTSNKNFSNLVCFISTLNLHKLLETDRRRHCRHHHQQQQHHHNHHQHQQQQHHHHHHHHLLHHHPHHHHHHHHHHRCFVSATFEL